MKNNLLKLDLESMSSEELISIQEKAKEIRLRKVENKIGLLEDNNKKIKNTLIILENRNKDLEEKMEKMKDDVGGVTKTLLTHGKEKRELENHIHSIIYKELDKRSIRDELFHGDLTRKCKHDICESLNVGAFNWIKVDDVDIAKRLARKYLNKESIHRTMRKRANDLLKKFDKLQSTNKKLKERELRQLQLLDDLINEVGGDINEI